MLKPLGDRVLVKPLDPTPPTTESGIELIESAYLPSTMGTVLVTGDTRHTFPVGTVVVFAPTAGEDVEIDGEPHIMLREKDLLAILE